MAEQAEFAFVKTFVNNLSSQPVVYSDDFQQPPQNTLRKVSVLQACTINSSFICVYNVSIGPIAFPA